MTVLVQVSDLSVAGVHALVIGVGSYPFLEGGSKKPTFQGSAGMKQLASPPLSAKQMSEWLQSGFRFDKLPIARMDVYASPGYQVADYQGNVVETEPPTFANVKKAARAWKHHADSNPNNVTVMFFCGHGLSVGAKEALLLEGYGDMSEGDHLAESFDPGRIGDWHEVVLCQGSNLRVRRLSTHGTCVGRLFNGP